MVTKCCVPGCKQRHKRGCAVTFHVLPKDPVKKDIWTRAFNKEGFVPPKNWNRICSKHFTDDSFDKDKLGGTWLKDDAIPTIFEYFNVKTSTKKRSFSPEKSSPNLPSTSPTLKKVCVSRNAENVDHSTAQPIEKEEKRAYYRYFGDFKTEPNSPRKVKKHFEISQKEIKRQRKVIRVLREKTRRIKKKNASLKTMLDVLKKKSLISDVARDTVEGDATSSENSNPNFEPEIVIKEEPIDIDEDQLPSTSRTEDEFILPWTPVASDWHPPADDNQEEDTTKRTSNGKSTKASKRKDGKVEIEQKEKWPCESEEEDSAEYRTKDHFDSYGEYIAAKLRKLDWKSCAYVQKAIGDIIFEAEMGKFR